MIRLAINDETRIPDSICISTGNTSKMWMLSVDTIIACVIETSDNVTFDPGGIIDEEIGDGGTVGDEVGADAGGGDHIFAVGVRKG